MKKQFLLNLYAHIEGEICILFSLYYLNDSLTDYLAEKLHKVSKKAVDIITLHRYNLEQSEREKYFLLYQKLENNLSVLYIFFFQF